MYVSPTYDRRADVPVSPQPRLEEWKSFPMKPNLEKAAMTHASPVSFLRSPQTHARPKVEAPVIKPTKPVSMFSGNTERQLNVERGVARFEDQE